MTVIWDYPTRVVYGSGATASLGEELLRLGIRRALLVTDPGVHAAVVAGAVGPAAQAKGCDLEVFDGVQGNPTEGNVAAGVAAYKAFKAQGVLAVGGGSALDVGKLVSACVGSGQPARALDAEVGGSALIAGSLPPVIAVPTTAGTGSEVGRAAVVTLDALQKKSVVFAPQMMPACAVLDPELTLGLPPAITAATGFDALTHCVEALCAKGNHPMADGIALEGIRLVSSSLVAATMRGGSDLAARGALMQAAMMGAVAFQKGLGACHSMAHPLSSVSGLHHGVANAVCLPAVIRFNGEAISDAASRALRVLGLGVQQDPAETLARWLEGLREKLELPASLRSLGVSDGQIPELSRQAQADGCHADNPRQCQRDDFEALFRLCL